MAEYMLLLHEEPQDFSQLSPDAIQAVIGEYVAWSRKLEAEGKLIDGKKLKDDGGKQLSGWDGDFRISDGPFAEVKEVIGGYFAVAAADYDEASAIARDCPHLKYGGRIELREIEPTS